MNAELTGLATFGHVLALLEEVQGALHEPARSDVHVALGRAMELLGNSAATLRQISVSPLSLRRPHSSGRAASFQKISACREWIDSVRVQLEGRIPRYEAEERAVWATLGTGESLQEYAARRGAWHGAKALCSSVRQAKKDLAAASLELSLLMRRPVTDWVAKDSRDYYRELAARDLLALQSRRRRSSVSRLERTAKTVALDLAVKKLIGAAKSAIACIHPDAGVSASVARARSGFELNLQGRKRDGSITAEVRGSGGKIRVKLGLSISGKSPRRAEAASMEEGVTVVCKWIDEYYRGARARQRQPTGVFDARARPSSTQRI